MNARSLLNNAFLLFHFIVYIILKMAYKKKLNPTSIQTNKFMNYKENERK